MIEVVLYFPLIALVSLAGYYIRSLSLSGSVAAFVVGCFVVSGFGWRGLLLLGAFFATSSFWSKFKKQKKEKLDEMLEKGGRRDWVQVAANGSVTAIAALLHYLSPSDLWQMAFIVSIAAANSDTWASEIGVLSKREPISILTFKPAVKGTSGAISVLGLFASLMGSLIIVVLAVVLFAIPSLGVIIFLTLCGFSGSVIDTILGALVQVKFQCEQCGLITEKSKHCQWDTKKIKGIHFVNNDIVNLLSICLATGLGLLVAIIISTLN